jgi:flagellar motor switch protein FliN/FliY
MNTMEMQKTLAEIDRFGDVPVPVEVRIGSRAMTVADVIGLKAGSVLLLDKPAGETLELVIGNLRMGSVEVVVVDDKLAVRITETDRLEPPHAQRGREVVPA